MDVSYPTKRMLTGREGAGGHSQQRKQDKQSQKAPKSMVFGVEVERFCLKEK